MRIMLTVGEKLVIYLMIVAAAISFGQWKDSWEAGLFIFFMMMAALFLIVPDESAK